MTDVQTATSNPDVLPDQPLDDIFTLPHYMATHPQIGRWHEELVRKLRSDANGLPMNSVQEILLERIAFAYADSRYRELVSTGSRPARERQADNAEFRAMLDSFNRLLEKHNDKVVNDMLVQVQNVIFKALPDVISDPLELAALRRRLQTDFAAIEQ